MASPARREFPGGGAAPAGPCWTSAGALRVAGIFTLIGGLWILVSDRLVLVLVQDPETASNISTVKGWLFVLATAVLLYSLVARELRARRTVEDQLREANTNLQSIVSASPLPIAVLDREGRAQLWNPAAAAVFGWPADEVLGRPFPVVLPDQVREFEAHLVRVLQGEWLTLRGVVSQTQSGGRLEAHFFTAPLFDPQGQATGVLVMIEDVTRQRRDEELLQASEQRFRLMFESAPLGTLIVKNDLISLANAALARMFGFSGPEEMAGLPVEGLVSPAARAAFLELIAGDDGEEADTGAEGPFDLIGLRQDGCLLPVQVLFTRVHFPEGPGVVVFFSDQSAQVAAGKALERAERQLFQAQKLESVGRLTSGVAHDLNNLLTAILGFNEIGLEAADAASFTAQAAREVRTAAERATALTGQLLKMVRQQPLQNRPCDFSQIILELIPLLRRVIGENISITTELAEGLWPVAGDRIRFEQVLLNLVVNSRDAMPQGGRLRLATANLEVGPGEAPIPEGGSKEWVVVEVEDTGCGIAPELQEQVFEPYFTTKQGGKGTGIGLSTVYGIVNRFGGTIQCQSRVGEGTLFRVFFPRTQTLPEPLGMERLPQAGLSAVGTILVVEDEEPVRRLAGQILTHAGHRVFEAQDGQEAVALSAAVPEVIDLLVTDLVMPGLSGGELAERLRRDRPGLRVLFVSGYGEETLEVHGIVADGGWFLPKPWRPQDLLVAVDDVLKADQPPTAVEGPAA